MKTFLFKTLLPSNLLLFIFCWLSGFDVKAQNIGINGTGANAHASALLDVDATSTPSLGILIPRIALQAVNVAAPVTLPATSLLLYNTATASTGTNAVSPGYYYWDGVKWERLATGLTSTDNQTLSITGNTLSISNGNTVSLPNDAWKITGNAGTTAGTHFLGTTDNQDLVFKRNNGFSGLINQTLANTSFGYGAYSLGATGMNNTAIGYTALQSLTGGSFNTTVGSYASRFTSGGGNNSAFGYKAMEFNVGGSFNSVFGNYALSNNTSGNNNVAIGYEALESTTTGNNNVAIGNGAAGLIGNTGNPNIAIGTNALIGGSTTSTLNTANDNVAIGFEAMKGSIGVASTGTSNVALGNNALTANTTGGANTAIGKSALSNNASGSLNSALGFQALLNNTTGGRNTAIGYQALLSGNSSSKNTAVGHLSMYSNTTGNTSTAIGFQSLYSNTTGIENIAIGGNALYGNISGNFNIASGSDALSFNTIGSNNISNGYRSLFSNISGHDNTALGHMAGHTNVTGINNTLIGSQADVSAGTYTNATAIGYNSKVSASNALILGGTGADLVKVGIGIGSPAYDLHILNSTNNQMGQWLQNGDATGNNASSILVVGQGSLKYGYLAYHNDSYSNGSYPNLKANMTLLYGTQDLALSAGTFTNDIVLGNSVMGNQSMIIKGNGYVGIGTITPLNKFHVTDNSATFTGRIINSNASGTAVFGAGNNVGGSFLPSGSGASFSGSGAGMVANATGISSTGIRATGNSLSTYPALASGSGGAFEGAEIGVYGNSGTSVNTTNIAGGYFSNNVGDYAYVGYRTAGNVSQKINGTGAVSTIVKNTKNELVNLYCPEAPEVLFQDFGKGTLVNGVAHIVLDETFIKNVTVNEKHPLRVIIQLEGDCNGVYVTNKTGTSFDVKELQNGNSNVAFTYFVTANRADAYNEDGTLFSKFADVRYGEAPSKAKTKNETAEQVNR